MGDKTRLEQQVDDMKEWMQGIAKVQTEQTKILTKLASNQKEHEIFEREIQVLRDRTHELSQNTQIVKGSHEEIKVIKKNQKAMDDELKKSFKERDNKMFKLSLIVYSLLGGIAAIQFIAPLALKVVGK